MNLKQSTFIKVIFFLTLASAYIDAPALLLGIVVPSLFTIAISTPLIISTRHSLKGRVFWKLIPIIVLCFLSATLLSPTINLTEKLQGFVQILAAFIIAHAVFQYSFRNPEVLKAASLSGVILLTSLSFLEFANVIKVVSDDFRSFAFPSDLVTYLYSAPERDFELAGHERPKVFSAEPSFVSITFFVFSIVYLKLTKSQKDFWFLFFLSCAMMYLMRSPIIYVLPFILTYIHYLEKVAIRHRSSFVIILVFFLIINFFGYSIILEIVGRPLNHEDLLFGSLSSINSQTVRFVLPWLTVYDVFSHSPIFGSGLSGKTGIEMFSSFGYHAQAVMGTNNIATVFMYFGVIGGIAMFSFLLLFFRKCAPQTYLSFSMIFVFYSEMIGGFETIRYWLFLFVLLAAYRISDANFSTSQIEHKK